MTSLLIIITSAFNLFHPLKMSFTEMSVLHNGRVRMETRLFLDDLTSQIEKRYRLKEADFSSLTANGSKALQQYVNECLTIQQHDITTYFVIQSISLTDDNIALVVEMESNGSIDQKDNYKIKNTLLFDVYKKQKNLLIYKGQDYEKFYFTIDDPIQQLD